jgi:hypothetical protein
MSERVGAGPWGCELVKPRAVCGAFRFCCGGFSRSGRAAKRTFERRNRYGVGVPRQQAAL